MKSRKYLGVPLLIFRPPATDLLQQIVRHYDMRSKPTRLKDETVAPLCTLCLRQRVRVHVLPGIDGFRGRALRVGTWHFVMS